jgi:hypothetical protein
MVLHLGDSLLDVGGVHFRDLRLPGFGRHLLLPFPPECCCCLDGTGLTGLYVVPPSAQLTEESGFLKLSLEKFKCAFQAVFIIQLDLGHPGALMAR